MKLELLQCLRGIAALMVVLFHFSSFLEPVLPGSASWFSSGYLGVDIFFVLSGFIIYVSTEKPDARDGAVFLTRRICRVVLPAWAAMVISVLVMPPRLIELVKGVLFIPLTNAAPPGFGYSFLIVAWTLTYELIFYGLFALVLSFTAGRAKRGILVSGVLFLLVFAVQLASGSFTLNAQLGPVVGPAISLFPFQLLSLLGNPILLEFIVGIFLGWTFLRGYLHRPPLILSTAVGALAALVVISFQFRPGHGLSCGGLITTVIVVYTLLLQAKFQPNTTSPLGILSSQKAFAWCVFAGDISYSLYLIHPTVKALLIKLGGMSSIPSMSFLVALMLTLIGSVLFYRYVELPAQALGRHLSARRAVRQMGEAKIAN